MSYIYEILIGVSNDLSNWENFYCVDLSSLCISGKQWLVKVVSSYIDCNK